MVTLSPSILAGLALTLAPLPAAAQTAPFISAYSPLSGATCHVRKMSATNDESVQACPGVAGYQLQVVDSDARMSLNLVAPGGKVFPLRFWDVVTRSFSSLGEQAEWRLKVADGKQLPMALIVRVKASEDPASNRQTEYLVVARLNPDSACVVARIAPGAGMNQQARDAADEATQPRCLPDLP